MTDPADPVLGALTDHVAVKVRVPFIDPHDEARIDRAADAEQDALVALISTKPTTLAGCRAYARHMATELVDDFIMPSGKSAVRAAFEMLHEAISGFTQARKPTPDPERLEALEYALDRLGDLSFAASTYVESLLVARLAVRICRACERFVDGAGSR